MTFLSKNAFSKSRSQGGFTVSFEVFPARNTAALDSLTTMAGQLAAFDPSFMSVTYGAGGSTQAATIDTVTGLARSIDRPIAGHLTCVGASRAETDAAIAAYRDLGLKHIVALRGDAPAGHSRYSPHPDGYRNAADLVDALARQGGFDISVAAYPEVHPDSPSRTADLDNLQAKFDAGADRAITQFFFDNAAFYRLRDEMAGRGIARPIVPGVLLIHDFAKVCNFAAKCSAAIPDWLSARFDGLEDDMAAQQLVAVSVAAEQVLDLAAQGVTHFHFFTLNRPDLALAVCRCLGLAANPHQPAAA